MAEVSLYKKYLALDALLKAIDEAGTRISTGSLDISVESRERFWKNVDLAVRHSGIDEENLIHHTKEFSVVDGDLNAFLDCWHGSNSKELMIERGRILESLIESLGRVGEVGVVVDSEDGCRFLLGRILGATFSLRVGVMAGAGREVF